MRYDPNEIRTLIRLRAALLVWCIFVVGVFCPPVLLAWVWVPRHLRRYRRRLQGPIGLFGRTAVYAEATYRGPYQW